MPLAAAEQENESVHDKVYGGISAPNTTFLKKLTNMMTMRTDEGQVRDTCVIGINQVRDNIKDPNAPYKAPGGNALEHAKLVDIYIESGGLIGDQPVFTPAGWKQQFVPTGKKTSTGKSSRARLVCMKARRVSSSSSTRSQTSTLPSTLS